MNRLLLFLSIDLIFGILSCTNPSAPKNELAGHWHNVQPGISTPDSYDIFDSTIIVDQFSLIDGGFIFSLYDTVDGSIAFPIFCGCGSGFYPEANHFVIRDNILEFNNFPEGCYYSAPLRFIKADPEICKKRHAFARWESSILLGRFRKSTPRFVNWDSLLNENNSVIVMGVGFAKDRVHFGNEPKIIVNDICLEIKDIDQLLQQTIDISNPKVKTVLGLVIDQSVPTYFVENLKNKLAEYQLDLFQFSESDDGDDFGFVKIQLSEIAT